MRIVDQGCELRRRLSLVAVVGLLAIVAVVPPCIGADEKVVPPATPSAAGAKPEAANSHRLSRLEFAEAMGKLREGMTEAEVRSLLGPPDDVRTQHDSGGIRTVGTVRAKEIWRYGTSGHLTTATLGEVYIGDDGHVQYIFGQGRPRLEGLPEEPELRRLLGLLGQVSSYDGGILYNPRTVIRAVNALLPLGKEKAMSVIDEFLRVTSGLDAWDDQWTWGQGQSGRAGVFLVLRTLFEVPTDPGYMPAMGVGTPHPAAPEDRKRLPRFPIVVEGDIPFLVVESYELEGFPEKPDTHARYFREHGTLRAKPLVPIAEPFKALDALVKSDHWTFHVTANDKFHDEQDGRYMLDNQLLRLLDSVYRTEPNTCDLPLPFFESDPTGSRKTLADVSRLKIRWDSKADKYTFLDGTTLPEPKPTNYRREIWKPTALGQGVEFKLIVERQNPVLVSILLEYRWKASTSDAAVFRIYNTKTKNGQLIAEITAEGNATQPVSGNSVQSVELKEEEEVTARLTVDGKTQISPVFKP